MTPYLIAGAALISAAAGFYGGWAIKQGQWDAATVAAQQESKTQREQQDAAIAKQNQAHADQVRSVNRKLADALERLRNRPERASEPARAACEGGTGAELSGPDAAFLEREAARADELRSAVSACYAWIDQVTGQ